MADDLPGGTIIGPYVIVERLGEAQGGMSVVYEAQIRDKYRRDDHPRRVILKVAGAEQGNYLMREALYLSRLDHRGILRPLPRPDVSSSISVSTCDRLPGGRIYYLATEYQPGGSLANRMARKGKLSVHEAVGIARQVARILEYIHSQGLVYLDLKPGNILFRQPRRWWQGTIPEVVLCDCGSAREANRAQGGEIPMTVAYASPEQVSRLRTWREPGPRSDLYSLGVTLYEMITGVVPFDGNLGLIVDPFEVAVPPSVLCRDTPLDLEAIILRAMAKDPQARFESAAAMASALERVRTPIEMDLVGRWALVLAGLIAMSTVARLAIGALHSFLRTTM